MSEEKYEYNGHGEGSYPDFIKESQTAYQAAGDPALERLLAKKQGEYTIEDYYALPKTCRVELMDGVIYNMTAPTYRHQGVGGELFVRFHQYIMDHQGSCFPFMSPIDVQLDRDDKTMVQPDLIVTCNRDEVRERVYYGAPDFVIEILSPSNTLKEQNRKYHKYKNAGVREYWDVDPWKKLVTVHDFEHKKEPAVYTFEDKVPVGIFRGDLEIDFAEIYENIQFLYE
ncbi:MAG: Uma2 family endonuclease [Eubacteriales bacterium]|nr:Uma2 family endonuclease [Eubacteriales bacterium]